MPVHELTIEGYRSIREFHLQPRSVNVITGPNGCGKSNLYNAVYLLARSATGGLGAAIAQEGGMPSVLWAGPEGRRTQRKPKPRRVILSVRLDDYTYRLELGLPASGPPQGGFDREGNPVRATLFAFDPEVKEEAINLQPGGSRPVVMLDRKGPSVSVRDAEGRVVAYPLVLDKTESTLAQIAEPHRYPEVSELRESMRRWRFYHGFRTDAESPLRRPRAGVMTTVLDGAAADLAAALQTIVEIGDADALNEAIDSAFSGGKVEIVAEGTQFRLRLHMPGILRPLEAPELSDGTLRFLCVTAALLSPRPPGLMALNEPETSLHPDLLSPLARLIATASRDTQVWVTSHAPRLTDAIAELTGVAPVRLQLREGATCLAN